MGVQAAWSGDGGGEGTTTVCKGMTSRVAVGCIVVVSPSDKERGGGSTVVRTGTRADRWLWNFGLILLVVQGLSGN